MDRRRLLLMSLAGALAAPLAAGAQQAGKVYRIGLLGTVPLSDPVTARIWSGFFDGLRQLGYLEGSNVAFEFRSSQGQAARLAALAAELVDLNVDIIVAAGATPVAARKATAMIPIVMPNHGDPVGRGLVVSLARPGGNITGLSIQAPDLIGKQLQVLKETLPRISHLAVLTNPTNPGHASYAREAEAAARRLTLRLQILEARTPADVPGAVSAAVRPSVDAIFVLSDPMFFGERVRIAEATAMNKLPLIAAQAEFAHAGGLVAYGVDQRDSFRRAATYVDRILKGAKPGDLPIEQPTKFELVINVKTARALGLTIPPSLLARADHVIE